MTGTDDRFEQLFFEAFEALPRQGPGSLACTEQALRSCGELPDRARILDLGCGTGAQTLHLAELCNGSIVAVDRHSPNVERLGAEVASRGLQGRIQPLVADATRLGFAPERFDLIWSEGALYGIGLERAFAICHRFLRPGGRLAFTDAVWRTPEPPAEVRAIFEAEYPTMGRVEDVLAALERAKFTPISHFPLPDEAWWDEFYGPLEQRIESLRRTYAGDPDALAALDRLAQEPAMHRRHGATYGYEFFVARR